MLSFRLGNVSGELAGDLPGHAFISYVREDRERVDRLQVALEQAGIGVWRDTANLWPGQDWKLAIREAITNGSLAFIACFSENSERRVTSYQNEELVLAVEQMRFRPPGRPWLFPIRFAECTIPLFDLGAGRRLDTLQSIDLFDGSWELGIPRLVAAVLNTFNSYGWPAATIDVDHAEGAAAGMRSASAAAQHSAKQRGHLIICGASALAVRTTEELTTRYGANVTMIAPSMENSYSDRLAELPNVRVVESAGLPAATFRQAEIAEARALGLLGGDDMGNLEASFQAHRLNPNLRLVVNVHKTAPAHQALAFFRETTVLAESQVAAPEFVAAALGAASPVSIRLAGRTLYVAGASDVPPSDLMCVLADTHAPGPPRLLPKEQNGGDLVLGVTTGMRRYPHRNRGFFSTVKDATHTVSRRVPHVIVVGLGYTGIRIMGLMHDLGFPLVCVDSSELAPGVSMARRLGIPVVIGSAVLADTLRAARVGNCFAIVCVTGTDLVNVQTALEARALAGGSRIVLRISDDDLADRAARAVGNAAVLPATGELAVHSFAVAMLGHAVLRTIPIERQVLLIADVSLGDGSDLVGSPVVGLNRAGSLRVLAVQRNGAVHWMPYEDRLVTGDRLVVVATPDGIGQLLPNEMSA